MKTLKDIFYDLNDILVALIIVAIAAFVIAGNIDSILNYPTSIAEEIQIPEEETPTNYAENPTDDQQGSGEDTSGQGTTGAGIDQENPDDQDTPSGNGEVENYSVYINPGSTGEQIADLLIGVGLFEDRQEFYDAVTAAGADGKLQAGNFIIPSDSTPAEVVSIITK